MTRQEAMDKLVVAWKAENLANGAAESDLSEILLAVGHNSLSKEWARVILDMAEVCFSEGIGPDDSEILKFIAVNHPELKAEYPHLKPFAGTFSG